jgi:hypothetical protein
MGYMVLHTDILQLDLHDSPNNINRHTSLSQTLSGRSRWHQGNWQLIAASCTPLDMHMQRSTVGISQASLSKHHKRYADRRSFVSHYPATLYTRSKPNHVPGLGATSR